MISLPGLLNAGIDTISKVFDGDYPTLRVVLFCPGLERCRNSKGIFGGHTRDQIL